MKLVSIKNHIERENKLKNKKGWMRIVEAFIAIILIMTVMLVVIQRQRIGLNSVEEVQLKQRRILNMLVRDEAIRSEVLSWKADLINEKMKYLVPAGYNYSIELCDYDKVCPLNFTVPTAVITDETLVISNLTYYNPNKAVKIKLFFWKGPFPEGKVPRNYSEPFREPVVPGCSNECTILGTKRCSSLTSFKTCGQFDSDSCTEWSAATSCGTGQMCSAGGCVGAYPVLSVSYTTPQRNTGANPGCLTGDIWYKYDMTVMETGSVTGTVFGSRLRCFYSNQPATTCDPLKTTMPTGMPSSISAGQTITVLDRWFCLKPGYINNMTEIFYSDGIGTKPLFNYSLNNLQS